MNYLLNFLIMLFILLFFLSFTPLITIFSIVGQTLSMVFLNFFFLDLSWFSLMIILLYLGGVMIIFLYMNSVSSKLIIKNNYHFFLASFLIFCYTYKLNPNYISLYEVNYMFYSLKEFYFIWFIVFLFVFIFLVNNLILNIKSPLNNNL